MKAIGIVKYFRDAFFLFFVIYIFSPYVTGGIVPFKIIFILAGIWNILAYLSDPQRYLSNFNLGSLIILMISIGSIVLFLLYGYLTFLPLFSIYMMIGFYVRMDSIENIRFSYIVNWSFLLYIWGMGIYSVYLYTQRPGLARFLASGNIEQTSEVVGFFTANYVTINSIALVAICIFSLMVREKSWKLFCIFVISLYMIIQSEYMTPLMYVFFGCVAICFVNIKSSIKKSLIVLICCAIFVSFNLFNFSYVSETLLSFADMINSPTLKERLIDLINIFSNSSLKDVGGNTSTRVSLYALSMNTFLSHMWFGIGADGIPYKTIGGHSSMLDLFAYNGIIGGFLFFLELIILSTKSYFCVVYSHSKKVFLLLLTVFFAVSFINIIFVYALIFLLFVLIPHVLNLLDSSFN